MIRKAKVTIVLAVNSRFGEIMPVSRLLKTSLLAISAVIVAESCFSSREEDEDRKAQWQTVLTRNQKEKLAQEKRLEEKKQKQKEARLAVAQRKNNLPKQTQEVKAKPVEQKPEPIVAAQVEPLIEQAPVSSVQPKEKKPRKRQGSGKKNQDWQVVSIRGTGLKQAPEEPLAAQPPRRQKAIPSAPRTMVGEEQSRSDEKWERTKNYLLTRAGEMGKPGLAEKAARLLDGLRKEVPKGLIQIQFEDYLLLMAYLPKSIRDGDHARAFRNIYKRAWSNLKDAELNSNFVGSLLCCLPEASRPMIAARLHKEALAAKFDGFKSSHMSFYKDLGDEDKLDVLQLLADRNHTKILTKNNFCGAFNELMEMLLRDENTIINHERRQLILTEASARIKTLKTLTGRVNVKKLYIRACNNERLAWGFLSFSEGVDLSEESFSVNFNKVYNAYMRETRPENMFLFGVRREDEALFYQVLKMVHGKTIFGSESIVNDDFASTVFKNRSPQELEILKLIDPSQDLWRESKPRLVSWNSTDMLTLYAMLTSLAIDMKISHFYWEYAVKDIITLSEKTSDPISRMEKRLDILKKLPEDVLKKIACDFWKMYVVEQLRIGHTNESNRYRFGMYYDNSISGSVYTDELLYVLQMFPEDEMLRAFKSLEGLIDSFARTKGMKISDDFRGLIEKVRSGLNGIGDKSLRLRALAFLERYYAISSPYVMSNFYHDGLGEISDCLHFFACLQNEKWMDSLMFYIKANLRVGNLFIAWFSQLDATTQEAVHDFWKGELERPKPNVNLSHLILKTGRDLPKPLADLRLVAAKHERQKIMTKMQSEHDDTAERAAKYVLQDESHWNLGIIDKDKDEVYQYAVMITSSEHKRQRLMTKMQSADMYTARGAAMYVLQEDNYRKLGVLDRNRDEVYQYAIMIESKTQDINNPLNPWNVYAHHTDMAKDVVEYDDIKTPDATLQEDGKTYYATADVFKGIRLNQVTYDQLPVHSKTYLRDMNRRLLDKRVLVKDPYTGAIVRQCPIDERILKHGLEGGHLEHVLSATGEPKSIVPASSAKLIAIVAHLQGMPDKSEDENVLSPQEDAFIALMAHANECETNKNEAIHKFYVSLPHPSRLPQLMVIDNSAEEYLRLTIEQPFLDLAENIFSCEGPFIRAMSGIKEGEKIRNGTHIELFVKNLLHSDIPFYSSLELDRYTRGLDRKLLTLTRKGVLDALFSNYIKVQDLADAAMGAIHRELNTPKSPMITRLGEFFDAKGHKPELEFNGETNVTSISMQSVYELLHLLNFLKMR